MTALPPWLESQMHRHREQRIAELRLELARVETSQGLDLVEALGGAVRFGLDAPAYETVRAWALATAVGADHRAIERRAIFMWCRGGEWTLDAVPFEEVRVDLADFYRFADAPKVTNGVNGHAYPAVKP